VVVGGQVAGQLAVGEGLLTGYKAPALTTPPTRASQAQAAITDGRLRVSFRLPLNLQDEVSGRTWRYNYI